MQGNHEGTHLLRQFLRTLPGHIALTAGDRVGDLGDQVGLTGGGVAEGAQLV